MVGKYIIDRTGAVYNNRGQKKIEHLDKSGYGYYKLCVNGVKGVYKTHILQAKEHPEICGEWFEGCVVHHIDFNPRNNTPENLKVMTIEEHLLIHKNSDTTTQRRRNGQESRQVLCVDTGMVFKSTYEAARWVGENASASNIVACCRNKYGHRSAYGYKWEYYE